MNRRAIIVSLLGVLLFSAGCLAGVDRWTTSGPVNPYVLDIAIAADDSNIVFAGTWSGGFYKSTDAGSSWTYIDIHPFIHNEPSDSIRKFALDPSNSDHLFLATPNCFLESTDGGTTWRLQREAGASYLTVREIVFCPGDPSLVFYFTDQDGLFRSTDNGRTWGEAIPGSSEFKIRDICFDPHGPAGQTIYAGGWGTGVYKSTDRGLTWSTVNNGFLSKYATTIAIDPVQPGHVYAGRSTLYRSTDDGTQWSRLYDDVGVASADVVAFDPLEDGKLYRSARNRITYSTDGGTSWVYMSAGLDGSMVSAFAFSPIATNRYFLAGALTLFKASPAKTGWTTWAKSDAGMSGVTLYEDNFAFDSADPSRLYAGSYVLSLSTDGGISWATALPDAANVGHLIANPNQAGWLYTTNGFAQFYKSTDGGQNWFSSYLPNSTDQFLWFAPSPHDPETLYVASRAKGIFRSTNDGVTWQELGPAGKDLRAVVPDPLDPATIYGTSWSSPGIKSTDGGVSWTDLNMGAPLGSWSQAFLIDPRQNQTLYASFYLQDGIFKSMDGGNSWRHQLHGLQSSPGAHETVLSLAMDPQDSRVVYAGKNGRGIYRSRSGGQCWQPFNRGIEEGVPLQLHSPAQLPGRLYATTSTSYKSSRQAGGVYAIDWVSDHPVKVHFNPGQVGDVFAGSPSQVVPATSLTFQLDVASFPDASPANPGIIQLTLPPGVFLSQTLATGNAATASPLPQEGETVVDLAVSEYLNSSQAGVPAAAGQGRLAGQIGPHAVQLFRYVAGESSLQLRVNESTAGWAASPGVFLGVTIGLGAGVWPAAANSNWGAAGLGTQAGTLFHLDLGDFSFGPYDNALPVCLALYRQDGSVDMAGWVEPEAVNLFTLGQWITAAAPVVSRIGSGVADLSLADLDLDGRDDLVAVAGDAAGSGTGRLCWSYGQPDGAFTGLDWLDLPGVDPRTVVAGDVTGDARPDVLVGDASGQLLIYAWEDLFAGALDKAAAALLTLRLPGEPSDSLLEDVDGDGWRDYLYTDLTANRLVVLTGNGFTAGGSYPAGQEPVALARGDFNGDGAPDFISANRSDGSVSVFWNAGTGQLGGEQIPLGVQGPEDVDTGDFDRDGLDDAVVAASGEKALVSLRATPQGLALGPAGPVYFQKTPVAVSVENYDGQHGPDALVGFDDSAKLALCTSDASGALAYAYHLDTLGDVIVDPVQGVSLAADSVVTVAAGTSLGGVSSAQGLAAVTQQDFGVLHFPRSGAISFSVVNLAPDDSLLSLELYGDGGQARESATTSLSPGQQYARYFTDLMGAEAARDDRWVRAFLSEDNNFGLWLVNDPALTYLDGTRALDVRDAASEIVFPVVESGEDRFTRLSLVNPNKEAVQLSIELSGPDGTLKLSQPRLLAGRGRLYLDVETALPGAAGGDAILVRADRGVLGVEIFGDAAGAACLEGLPVRQAETVQYSSHLAVGDFGGVVYSTALVLHNAAAATRSAGITLYGDDGNPAKRGSRTVEVPARGTVTLDLGELFGLSGAASGYLKVDGQGQAGLLGCIVFRDAAGGRFVSSLPLQANGAARFLLGHIANGNLGGLDFFTGLAVLNVGSLAQEVLVAAHDPGGIPLGATVLNLGAGQRQVSLLQGLMPGLPAIFGGYLSVEGGAGAALLVFELFGNSTLDFLSAVPANPLP